MCIRDRWGAVWLGIVLKDAAVVSAVVLRRPTKEYTHPYSMMHRRSAYCRYWGLASLSPITSITTMRCDIDCASSFNLAKSTKYDSKTNGKKSIFQCMRAQAGELSQIPKMSLLEKLHEIPGILGGWYLNVPGSTNGFFNPLAYLHGKKNPYPHMEVFNALRPVYFI